MDLLPLETLFERRAEERKAEFPHPTVNYVEQYKGLLRHLRTHIYPNIDPGLAALSMDRGLYTAHNKEHFDEVVDYAGRLLGVEGGGDVALTAYELYVLLVAIRIHDAGNIHGREEHEKKCFTVLRDCGSVAGIDNGEKKVIASIAQAHGGKTASGDKDTIGSLNSRVPLGRSFIRSRLLASIVRFADEICENSNRASLYLLDHGTIPPQSELFHKYAKSIHANIVTPEDRKITLVYRVAIDDTENPFGAIREDGSAGTYLVDEIFNRLDKMDRERRYCNIFSRELYTVDAIRATIDIVDSQHDILETITVPELCDSGYPESKPVRLVDRMSEYCGRGLYDRLSSHIGSSSK